MSKNKTLTSPNVSKIYAESNDSQQELGLASPLLSAMHRLIVINIIFDHILTDNRLFVHRRVRALVRCFHRHSTLHLMMVVDFSWSARHRRGLAHYHSAAAYSACCCCCCWICARLQRHSGHARVEAQNHARLERTRVIEYRRWRGRCGYVHG